MNCRDGNVVRYENSPLLSIDSRPLCDGYPISPLGLFPLPLFLRKYCCTPEFTPSPPQKEKGRRKGSIFFYWVGAFDAEPDVRLAKPIRNAMAAGSTFLTSYLKTRLTKQAAPQNLPRCTPKRLSLFFSHGSVLIQRALI
jgi:hypothetical protein